MTRPSVRWLGALVLASLVVSAGCSTARPRGAMRQRGTPVASAQHGPYSGQTTTVVTQAPAAQPVAQPVVQTAPPAAQPNMLPPVTASVKEEAKVETPATPAAEPVAQTPASPTVETAKGEPDKDTTTVEQTGSRMPSRVVSHWTSTSPKNEAAPRRSFVDITAHSCFAHGDDYTWLTGQLQYLRAKECWRLRYASVDEDDAHGGSVTLVDKNGLLAACKDGQYVRITGQLLNAADRSIAPDYQLDSLQGIELK